MLTILREKKPVSVELVGWLLQPRASFHLNSECGNQKCWPNTAQKYITTEDRKATNKYKYKYNTGCSNQHSTKYITIEDRKISTIFIFASNMKQIFDQQKSQSTESILSDVIVIPTKKFLPSSSPAAIEDLSCKSG